MASSHPGPEACPPPAPLPPGPSEAEPVRALPEPASEASEGDPTSPPFDDRPPRTVADGWRWLAAALLGFLVGQVLSFVLLVAVAQLNGDSKELSGLLRLTVPPAWIVVCELVGLWAGFLGAVVVASRQWGTGRVRRDMRWGFRWWDPFVGVATGVVGQSLLLPLLYIPLRPFVPHLSQRLSAPAEHLTGGFRGTNVAVIAFLTVVVVPVVEELMFRGLVLRGFVRVFARVGRVLGPVLAMMATGVVFGLAHLEPLELLGLTVFGMVLAALAYLTNRLGSSIFAHATFNLVAILSVVYGSAASAGAIHGVAL